MVSDVGTIDPAYKAEASHNRAQAVIGTDDVKLYSLELESANEPEYEIPIAQRGALRQQMDGGYQLSCRRATNSKVYYTVPDPNQPSLYDGAKALSNQHYDEVI